MKTVTTHYAKTHLSQLLKEVQAGEPVMVLNGKMPVAKLIAVDSVPATRPRVGTVTSAPVTYADDTFAPMTEDQLAEWGI